MFRHGLTPSQDSLIIDLKNRLWECSDYDQFESIVTTNIDSSTTFVAKSGCVRWIDLWDHLHNNNKAVISSIDLIQGTPTQQAFAKAVWYADEVRRFAATEVKPSAFSEHTLRNNAYTNFQQFLDYKAADKITEAGSEKAGLNLNV